MVDVQVRETRIAQELEDQTIQFPAGSQPFSVTVTSSSELTSPMKLKQKKIRSFLCWNIQSSRRTDSSVPLLEMVIFLGLLFVEEESARK